VGNGTKKQAKKKMSPAKKAPDARERVSLDEIAEALEKTYGLTSVAAALLTKIKTEAAGKEVRITRQAIEKRIKKNTRLLRLKEDSEGTMLDFTEMELIKQIKAGNMTAIIFYLKCKGKIRGYIERSAVEVSGENGLPITPPSFVVNFVKPDKTKVHEKEFSESTTAQ
jgi:hypothetical protein